MTKSIVVVEDEHTLRTTLGRHLSRCGTRVVEAGSCEEAFLALARETEIHLVLVDLSLPDGSGFELVDRAAQHPGRPPVIMMTADGSIDNAIAAVQRGAADFLLKPFSFDALDEALRRALGEDEVSVARNSIRPPSATLAWRDAHAPGVLGRDPRLMETFELLSSVADTDCSVLVTGETGTGKELIARALHDGSDRRHKPFVTVNCAAIPENLLESELFGHAKGCFTGATQARTGRFVQADGGTIFLDEIGELPLALQAKFLRVLQEKEVTPLGDARVQKVDVRVVAATNRDLETMAAQGEFREDLLYRLAVIPVELTPLRERKGDIPDLVEHFVAKANERRSRQIEGVAPAAMEALLAYPWPGNVRQLEHMMERVVLIKSKGLIEPADLPRRIRECQPSQRVTMNEPMLPEEGINFKDAVEQFENALICQALERTGWNKNRAATILQMNRTTLVEKLKKKGLGEPQAA